MPCNLTARADATISNAMLAKMLDPQKVETIIREFVKAANLGAVDHATDYSRLNEMQVILRNGLGISVRGWSSGQIECFVGEYHGGSRGSAPTARTQQLVAALKAYFAQVTGLMIQAQVVSALKSKFTVETTQRASNGSLVVSVEV